ncbi:hypothetical protein STEG23_025247 [Scotinomys teguina]
MANLERMVLLEEYVNKQRIFWDSTHSGWLFQLSLEVPPPLMFPMTVMPLGRDQDCSLKNREPDVPAPWFLNPGGWSKITAVSLYFIFPGICTLSLDQDCSLKIREPDVPASCFLDPGGWSKTAAVSLYFIFPGICTLPLVEPKFSEVKGRACVYTTRKIGLSIFDEG